jgi:hypothetical protein
MPFDKGGDLRFDRDSQHFSGAIPKHFIQRISLFWLIQVDNITLYRGGVFSGWWLIWGDLYTNRLHRSLRLREKHAEIRQGQRRQRPQ